MRAATDLEHCRLTPALDPSDVSSNEGESLEQVVDRSSYRIAWPGLDITVTAELDDRNTGIKYGTPTEPMPASPVGQIREEDLPALNEARRAEYRDAVPGATHVDGTSRVQTVTDAATPRLAALLRRFTALTDVPA
ncbi:carbamoyltransferase C-terminal domain-containing protein [Streptomyces sp. PKU-EA00015]|uniref:carbamoyltransferase C-terminal domain-containing protein n=1 Tax=Streptomyces sp. PKU-EA00015 TaxID=2748326 RepID=UPI00281271C6|nr:carbamoyltransferase C-terminal domain-containing protein [Streptomyces sp. PKU-EA00015]